MHMPHVMQGRLLSFEVCRFAESEMLGRSRFFGSVLSAAVCAKGACTSSVEVHRVGSTAAEQTRAGGDHSRGRSGFCGLV